MVEKSLDRSFSEGDKDLVNILIDLKQNKSFSDNETIDGASIFNLQYKGNTKFNQQGTNQVNKIDSSNHQKFEQIPEIRDSVTEVDRLKGFFVTNQC